MAYEVKVKQTHTHT